MYITLKANMSIDRRRNYTARRLVSEKWPPWSLACVVCDCTFAFGFILGAPNLLSLLRVCELPR